MSNHVNSCGFGRLYSRSPEAGNAGTSMPNASWKNASERSMFSTNAVKEPVPRTLTAGVWPTATALASAATSTTTGIRREINRTMSLLRALLNTSRVFRIQLFDRHFLFPRGHGQLIFHGITINIGIHTQ